LKNGRKQFEPLNNLSTIGGVGGSVNVNFSGRHLPSLATLAGTIRRCHCSATLPATRFASMTLSCRATKDSVRRHRRADAGSECRATSPSAAFADINNSEHHGYRSIYPKGPESPSQNQYLSSNSTYQAASPAWSQTANDPTVTSICQRPGDGEHNFTGSRSSRLNIAHSRR